MDYQSGLATEASQALTNFYFFCIIFQQCDIISFDILTNEVFLFALFVCLFLIQILKLKAN